MKSILSLAISVGFLNLASAQITVPSFNINTGDVILQAATYGNITSIQDPGGSLYWDFSSMHPDEVDTLQFIDPATTNHASGFPTANFAMGSVAIATYFTLNSTDLVSLGFGGYIEQLEQDVEVAYTHPDTVNVFPITFGTQRHSTSYGEGFGTYNGYDFRVSRSTQRTQEVDAWGNLDTPEDNYDVIRMHEEQINIDSVFVITVILGQPIETYMSDYSTFDTSYFYNFYTDDATINYPLLEVEYDEEADTIIVTKWITFMPDGLNKIQTNNLKLFPNPAQDVLNIESNDAEFTVTVFNVSGQKVAESNRRQMDISQLIPSVYFVEYRTGNQLVKQKLIVE